MKVVLVDDWSDDGSLLVILVEDVAVPEDASESCGDSPVFLTNEAQTQNQTGVPLA